MWYIIRNFFFLFINILYVYMYKTAKHDCNDLLIIIVWFWSSRKDVFYPRSLWGGMVRSAVRTGRDLTQPCRGPVLRWLWASRNRAGSPLARRPRRHPTGWTDGERTVGDATASDGDGGDCDCASHRCRRRRSSCARANCFQIHRRPHRHLRRRRRTAAEAGGAVACSSDPGPAAICCCSPLPIDRTSWSLDNMKKKNKRKLYEFQILLYCAVVKLFAGRWFRY